MAFYLKPLQRPERVYVSRGLIIQSRPRPDFMSSQASLDRSILLDDSPVLPKEGLIVRLRAKKRQSRHRCYSDLRSSPLPELRRSEKTLAPGPVLKPKKAKGVSQVRSTSVLGPPGPYLEPPAAGERMSKRGVLPTMMMLKLVKPKAKSQQPAFDPKPSPHLKLVTIECPESLSHLHMRPKSIPRRLMNTSSLLESQLSSVRQLTLMSLKERTSCSSPYQERASHTPPRPVSHKKRKIVFTKRDYVPEELTDRENNLTLESYYM